MKWIRTAGIVICVLGLAFAGYRVFTTEKEYIETDNAYDAIAAELVSVKTPEPKPQTTQQSKTAEEGTDATPTPTPEAVWEAGLQGIPIGVNFQEAIAEYPDLCGWLYCEGTPINYPIMQSDEDDDYYLSHLPNGAYARAGSLFLENTTPSDFSLGNTVVYGHNMKNESMFGSLRRYRQQGYCDEHPTLALITPMGEYRLDVIAAFDTDVNSFVYQPINEWEGTQDFIHACMDRSEVITFARAEYDRVVVLSTCSTQEDLRFVVVCGMMTLIEYDDVTDEP